MKRLRILLCDDDTQILSLLQSILEPEYSVIGTAKDGQALVTAAQTLRPDLVVTDIEIPKMDGIEAVKELRKTRPDCRVIFHTSRTEPEFMAAAFLTGAAGYLVKGSMPSVVSGIRTALQHAQNRDEEFAVWKTPHNMRQTGRLDLD